MERTAGRRGPVVSSGGDAGRERVVHAGEVVAKGRRKQLRGALDGREGDAANSWHGWPPLDAVNVSSVRAPEEVPMSDGRAPTTCAR